MNREIVERYLKSAGERLESAKILLKAGNFDDSISRSYYAVLSAITAALLSLGESVKTHAGAITKFHLKFIKTGKVSKKFGGVLHKLERSRTEADYQNKDFTKEETKQALKEARELFKVIKEVLRR